MKRVSLLLVLCLIISCFAGCGGKEVATGAKDKIVIWSNNAHSKNFYNEKINEFNKTIGAKNGIEIEYIIKDNMGQAVELAFVSDQAPDLMIGATLEKLAGDGSIIAFDELKNGQKYIDKYQEHLVENRNMIKGKTYSLPLNSTTYGFIYNKDMFKAAGIVDENGEPTPPETWDEVIEYAKKLTNPDKQEYGIVFNAKDSFWFGSDINQTAAAAGGYVDGMNKHTQQFDFSVQAEIMKKIMQIKKDGSYVPGAEGLSNDAARARFAAGGIGMKTAGSYDYAVLTEQFPAKIDWGVAPTPTLKKGERYNQYCLYNANMAISRKSVEKYGEEKILLVYDYLSNDDFVVDMYKAGVGIPYDFSLVEDVKIKDKPQWQEFAELLEVSMKPSKFMSVKSDATGITSIVTIWSEIWAQKHKVSDIDRLIADYTKQRNAGIDKYIKDHPDYVVPEPAPKDTRKKVTVK